MEIELLLLFQVKKKENLLQLLFINITVMHKRFFAVNQSITMFFIFLFE